MNKAKVMNNLYTIPKQAMCKSSTRHAQSESNEQVVMLWTSCNSTSQGLVKNESWTSHE